MCGRQLRPSPARGPERPVPYHVGCDQAAALLGADLAQLETQLASSAVRAAQLCLLGNEKRIGPGRHGGIKSGAGFAPDGYANRCCERGYKPSQTFSTVLIIDLCLWRLCGGCVSPA